MKKIKLGLFGLGHLGKIHVTVLENIPEIDLVGYYDPDPTKIFEGLQSFDSEDLLLDACEAVDIVSTTESHGHLIKKSLQAHRHVFVEKPMTASLAEANLIKNAALKEPSLVFQVGHVERFNPAYKALSDMTIEPLFIEVDRLATFNQRGTDVSVIMDVMIHDLDIILSLVDDTVSAVYANGVSILSATPDICNARIEFAKGCVANVTASRISLKQMRKFRIFQKDAYISLDLLDKKAQIISITDQKPLSNNSFEISTDNGAKYIDIHEPLVEHSNAIQDELWSFYEAIVNNKMPKVGVTDGYKAIALAEMILDIVNANVRRLVS